MSEEADTEVGVDSKDKTENFSKTKAKVKGFWKIPSEYKTRRESMVSSESSFDLT